MGQPSIDIVFKTKATEAVERSSKGVVALIVKDSKANGPLSLADPMQIPTTLGVGNQEYIQRAFVGYANRPRKVLVFVLPSAAEDLSAALTWLGTQVFDYLAGPSDCTETEATAIAAWVKGRRQNDKAICKAILPNMAADSEAVVNFATEGIIAGAKIFTAAQYCSRMAGLIAGTPMTIACTYAPLPELSDVTRLTREEADAAEVAGKLILFHDGEKVKSGRGVTSLVTTTAERGGAFKKIKLVETIDMIGADIRMTLQDNWIGKRSNSYDDKCLLCTAIKGYLMGLEQGGILQAGRSAVAIDVAAQRAYLESTGVDTSQMSEQQIKEANTGTRVFLRVSVGLLDAIEDIGIAVEI